MKPYLWSVLLVVLAAGCGDKLSARPQELNPPSRPGIETASYERPSMAGRGITLRLYDSGLTAGASRKPTVIVQAEEYSLDEKEHVWTLEKTHAVIYGAAEEDADIVLDAGRGRFREERTAYLKDGVIARIGEMEVQLTDLEWLNDEQMGRSDHPVSIITDGSKLNASSLRLYPEEQKLILTDVTGTIRFTKNAPPPVDAP
ncbi:MAG: LPS export ABC transporter periplasmic protein LptC [Nitrospiraceae bacterium]|nr:LPS export ABC transporter periplasmic protein LptC [Nitrospiraceae bacterium]